MRDHLAPKPTWSFLDPFRRFGAWLGVTAANAGRNDASDPHATYRNCPKCGKRDFRMSDRQRARPEIYRSRDFLVKWLCLGCGHRETAHIVEPE